MSPRLTILMMTNTSTPLVWGIGRWRRRSEATESRGHKTSSPRRLAMADRRGALVYNRPVASVAVGGSTDDGVNHYVRI